MVTAEDDGSFTYVAIVSELDGIQEVKTADGDYYVIPADVPSSPLQHAPVIIPDIGSINLTGEGPRGSINNPWAMIGVVAVTEVDGSTTYISEYMEVREVLEGGEYYIIQTP